MTSAIKVVSLLAALQYASADYSKVTGETCSQLQDPTAMFDAFLFPCATFETDSSVELECITS